MWSLAIRSLLCDTLEIEPTLARRDRTFWGEDLPAEIDALTEAAPSGVQPSSWANDQVICTLFEGDYHLGVAVLINSIVANGFRGLFWVGYRGNLPPWLDQLTKCSEGLYQVGEAVLTFELLDAEIHFTHFKPAFMNSLIDRRIATCSLWYFDPDITVRCSWNFYERWAKFGVCLCQDVTMGSMPSDHPLRLEWIELAHQAGWPAPVRKQERYYNGGFLGLQIDRKVFLDTWERANELARAYGVNHSEFQTGDRANTFQFADQDALNITVMFADVPLSTIGPEGMGWINGGYTMYHSAGGSKPWRKKFLRSALAAKPPWNGDKHFLQHADGAIKPFSPAKLRRMRRAERLGSIIGRFYHRQ